MFDIVRNNRRIVQIFLALITLPFAFWGVESYIKNAASGVELAMVGSSKITATEFQQAMQKQQERLRASLGGASTQEMLDTPEIRKSVLDNLINQRLLSLHAARNGISVSDAQLLQMISTVPSLQENGKFSHQRYEALVASQGLTKEGFETRLRQDLALQQMVGSIADASITGTMASDRWLAAILEEREVSSFEILPENFVGQINLAASSVKAFYEANKSTFSTPEQIKTEYVVLNQAALAEQVTVSDEEIKAWYGSHQDQFRQAEQRRASHILITVEKNAPVAAVKSAEDKAVDLLARLRKTPGEFAALAKQYSQDPGSAAKGGDLDWFGRGSMVKPFEDAAFSLQEGSLSDLVRSDFGFHIIRVTGVRQEQVRPLAEVRDAILSELKMQSAARRYAELAEGFSNTVYEQADSLQPVVDKFKLKLEHSDWLGKGTVGAPPFSNPKLVAALFSEDVLKNKRNTEAIEIAPGVLVAARVSEHRPAVTRPFEEVRPAIEQKLMHEEQVKLVIREGESKLASLRKGAQTTLAWSSAHNIPRLGAQGVSQEATRAIFKADATKLPTYAGHSSANGSYTLYRISKVTPFSGGEDPRARLLRQQYARIVAGEEFSAWLAALRKLYPVEINERVLDRKEH
jgi:peptidyl-prolyl cis-trans isomerase D